MADVRLSTHFWLSEMTGSQTAARHGWNNIPSGKILENLKHTADNLEFVRAALGHPVSISSGYRCPALNKAIGGAMTSQHLTGEAADFTCREFGTVRLTFEFLRDHLVTYDQLILEFGQWVHVSFSASGHNRHMAFEVK